MDLKERILAIRAKALGEIENGARRGDTPSIISNTKIVEGAEQLLNRWEGLRAGVEFLEAGTSHSVDYVIAESTSPRSFENVANGLSPRIRGDKRRKELIKYLTMIGVDLTHRTGSSYLTNENKLVGIAYASERRPNRWFLGLPDNDYHALILICEKGNVNEEKPLNIVLPNDIYQQYRSRFSKKDDQLKFNITTRRELLLLLIPYEEPLILNTYIDNYAALTITNKIR